MSNDVGVDLFVPTEELPWLPLGEEFAHGGVEWRFVHLFEGGERWTAMYRGPAGSYIRPHIHTGAAEGYTLYGKVQVAPPHVLVGAGFLREKANAHHPKTVLVEDTAFILTMTGPLAWIGANGTQVIQTGGSAQQLWQQQLRKLS
jgi:hypothetical protein